MNAPEQHRTHGFNNSRTCGSGKGHANFHVPARFLLENLYFSTRAAIPRTQSGHGERWEIPKIHQETSSVAPGSSFIFKNVFPGMLLLPEQLPKDLCASLASPRNSFGLKFSDLKEGKFNTHGIPGSGDCCLGITIPRVPTLPGTTGNGLKHAPRDRFPRFFPLGLCRHQENSDFPEPASPYMEGFILI